MEKDTEVIIIGSGIAGLATASLLSRDAYRVTVLEQNWLPGGCMSSYPRKGYIFESGATTLVGLEPHMPLGYLLSELNLELNAWELDIPMKVVLKDGTEITRYNDLNLWIEEAERVFGKKSQRAFWEYCFKVSEFVWETSLKQKAFPPSSFSDLWHAAKNFEFRQVEFARFAFQSMESLLKRFQLLDNKQFVDFVNEQLLITAQNHIEEVNILFGTTALCYTNYPNYYVPGGLIKVADLLVEYIHSRGGQVIYKKPVTDIKGKPGNYRVETLFRSQREQFSAQKIVSAVPINNTLEFLEEKKPVQRLKSKLMGSKDLYSAFTMGLVIPKLPETDCIHYQIHLENPLPVIGSKSIFLSLSHPEDFSRCGPEEMVASISTHIQHPEETAIEDKGVIEDAILEALTNRLPFAKKDIIFQHSSTARSWEKWTSRSWGFVGGYPQYMSIKPWQMMDSRLVTNGLYLCGDSTYPGQGIPGACLSGIIAHQKMSLDSKKNLRRIYEY